MADVGRALGEMLGGGYVNYFSLSGRSYRVIPQVMQRFSAPTVPTESCLAMKT